MNLTKITLDKSMTNIFKQSIDPSLIKERTVGKTTLSYISGSTVIDILNNVFGYCWNWSIDKEWIENGRPFFNQYSKDKTHQATINGKNGAWEEQGDICHVRGTLTVELTDENGVIHKVSKTAYGSKCIVGKQDQQDSIFKAASTDAIKKAASYFGIGLELYRDEDEQIYFESMDYEDPWTPEETSIHAEELKELNDYVTKYELDQEWLSQASEALTGNPAITPSNIADVIKYIKENIN